MFFLSELIQLHFLFFIVVLYGYGLHFSIPNHVTVWNILFCTISLMYSRRWGKLISLVFHFCRIFNFLLISFFPITALKGALVLLYRSSSSQAVSECPLLVLLTFKSVPCSLCCELPCLLVLSIFTHDAVLHLSLLHLSALLETLCPHSLHPQAFSNRNSTGI